jgi:hypothetical protein
MSDRADEATAAEWTTALRRSHDRLRGLVEPLDADALHGRSYASEWSIAQVLSHLGSGAEIFSLLLDAGWSGDDRRAEGGGALVERFESIDPDGRKRFRLHAFGMDSTRPGWRGCA